MVNWRGALGRAYYGLGVHDKAHANLQAAQDLLTPLGEDTAAWVAQNYGAGESWVDLGT